jgi:hypothetical protein
MTDRTTKKLIQIENLSLMTLPKERSDTSVSLEEASWNKGGGRAELLNYEGVRTQVCKNFVEIIAKILLLNAKQGKQALFYDFGTI